MNRKNEWYIPLFLVIFLLMALSGLSINHDGINYSQYIKELVAGIGFPAVLLLILLTKLKRRDFQINLTPTHLSVLLLVGFAGLSGLWAANLDFYISTFSLYVAALCAGIIVVMLAPVHHTWILISRTLVFTAFYIAFFGLLRAVLSIEIFGEALAPSANYVNPNIAAQVVLLCMPLHIYLILCDKAPKITLSYWLSAACCLAFIFHTSTQAVWLGLAIQMILLIVGAIYVIKKPAKDFFNQKPDLKKWRIHGLIAILLMLVLVNVSERKFEFFWHELSTGIESIEDRAESAIVNKADLDGRLLIWQSAWEMVKEQPLVGHGLGAFYHNITLYADRYSVSSYVRTHNDFINAAVELGFLGILLLGVVMVVVLGAFRRIFRDGESEEKILFFSIFLAMVGSAINAQFSFPYQMPVPPIIMAIYIGLLFKCSAKYHQSKALKINNSQWYAGLAGVALILFFQVAMHLNWYQSWLTLNKNLQRSNWIAPVAQSQPHCTPLLTKMIHLSAQYLYESNRIRAANGAAQSFEHCFTKNVDNLPK